MLAVQDDNGSVEGALSYVDATYFRAYHLDRGNNVSTYTDAQVESALVKATDYMDGRWSFIGQRSLPSQRTQWPRFDASDSDDQVRTGIPIEVKEAQCEYALVALTSRLDPNPTRDASGRGIKSKATTVGPISKEIVYDDSIPFSAPKYPVADQKLRRLVSSGGPWFERG